MRNGQEVLGPPRLPEQVRTGISLTAKTLGFYGLTTPDISEIGRVDFVPEAVIKGIERKVFLEENGVVALLGSMSDPVISLLFESSGRFANDGKSVALSSDFFRPLVRLRGENMPDRKAVSGFEVILFDMTAISALGIAAKREDAPPSPNYINGAISDFRAFLINAEGDADNGEVSKFRHSLKELIDKADESDFSLEVKGLSSTICYKGESLFTANYYLDQSMRFYLINRMRKKYSELMSNKHFWFAPSEKINQEIPIEPRMLEVIESLFSPQDTTEQIISQYISGEMGVKFVSMKEKELQLEAMELNKDLAVKIKQRMTSGGDFSGPDYSKYEVDVEVKKPEVIDDVDEEELYPERPIRRGRNIGSIPENQFES